MIVYMVIDDGRLFLQVDLVGVHHMQAHALTPRLVAALQNSPLPDGIPNSMPLESDPAIKLDLEPAFPFLSLLASGGHTLLIHSASLTEHKVLASTNDIAVGECLDKVARVVLPPEILQTVRSTMYGALLEKFGFPETSPLSPSHVAGEGVARTVHADAIVLENLTAAEYQAKSATRYTYTTPRNNEEALSRTVTKWGWRFKPLLARANGGVKVKSMEMSFSGLMTAVERAVRFKYDTATSKLTSVERSPEEISMSERRDIAREAMRAAFEHVVSRVLLGLQEVTTQDSQTPVTTIVLAGGVAANSYLRHMYV